MQSNKVCVQVILCGGASPVKLLTVLLAVEQVVPAFGSCVL